MKNQSNYLYGESLKNYENIPILFSCLLDRIIDLFQENPFNLLGLFPLFCNLVKCDLYDQKVNNLKQELNNEIQTTIMNNNDIKLLILVLYSWFDESITSLIDIEKIKVIFKFLDNIKESLSLFLVLVDDNRLTNEKILLYNTLRSHFSLVENECIAKLSLFFDNINETLKSKANSTYDLYEIKYKICERVLGKCKLSDIKSINAKSTKKFKEITDGLIQIIDFYALIMNNEKNVKKFNKLENILSLSEIFESNGEYDISINDNFNHKQELDYSYGKQITRSKTDLKKNNLPKTYKIRDFYRSTEIINDEIKLNEDEKFTLHSFNYCHKNEIISEFVTSFNTLKPVCKSFIAEIENIEKTSKVRPIDNKFFDVDNDFNCLNGIV